MLDLLRRGVKTWVAKALFALLVVSFAVWGIGDVFSGGVASSVAQVGDRKIPAERFANAVNRETRATAQRFGQPLDTEMVRALGIPQRVLAGLAQEATLDEAVAALRVSAPDDAVREAILADPSFLTPAGGFDQERYRYLLAQKGFSVEGYEAETRRALARDQLVRALTDGAAAPAGLVDALYAWQTETRVIEFVTLGADLAGEIPEPDEAALSAHHEANAGRFSAPERRSAVFLHLSLDALAEGFEPEEEDLEALYAERQAEFDQPERRRLFQIVFNSAEEAAAAAARIGAGEADFDAILAERGEGRADVALGFVTRDEVAEAAAAAAFALDAPGVAGPADTGFGFALIDVAEIAPAESVSFEEARPALEAALKRDAALDRAPEIAGEAEDRRAAGLSLEEIGEELSLPVGRASLVAESGAGGAGFTASPDFLAELFSAEEGEERDFVETQGGEFFLLRVTEIAPASLIPLAETRAAVAADWRAERVGEALGALAEGLAARLGAGETLEAVAAELGREVGREGPKTRVEGWAALPPELVERLFRLERGGFAFAPGAGGFALAQVSTVAPGEGSERNRALRASLSRQMDQMAAADALTLFIAAKQQALGVSVNQRTIDSILSTSAGF